jgi:hypothetical protein
MSTEPLENLEELARRAVACKRWRWMPGMLSAKGLRVTRRDSDGYVVGYYEDLSYIAECVPGTLPDLTDPATLGCLLALVREAHGAPAAYFMGSVNNQWVVHHFTEPEAYWKSLTKWQPTEAEALVAALEVAP